MITNPINLILEDLERYYYAFDHKEAKKPFYLKVAILFNNPNVFLIILYRLEFFLYNNNFIILKLLGIILYPFYFYISYFIFDVHIHPSTKIGKGFYAHNRGIIITQTADIGENVTIIGPVTIGTSLEGGNGAQLGNNVTICAGARIIGYRTIGDNVIIGANAVVVHNFPSKVTIGGIPAKIIKKSI